MVQHFVRIVPTTSANSDPLQPLIGIIWLGWCRFHPLQRFNQSDRRAPLSSRRHGAPGRAERRVDRNLSRSIPKQILQFGKDGAIGASQGSGEISLLVDAIRLPIVVIVAEIDRGAGVDAVGQQEVQVEFL